MVRYPFLGLNLFLQLKDSLSFSLYAKIHYELAKFMQLKGQTVQDYTHEFRKRVFLLGVNLNSQDTLLKYIGGLHSYLKHTILMFNPSNLDEVCVQAMHLEAR